MVLFKLMYWFRIASNSKKFVFLKRIIQFLLFIWFKSSRHVWKTLNIIYCVFAFIYFEIISEFGRLVKNCRFPINRSLRILLILAPRGVPLIRASFLIDFIIKINKKGTPNGGDPTRSQNQ